MDPEVQLLQRLSAKDEQALAELYRLLSPHVYALALRMLGNAQEAEEILQDSFLRLFDNADKYDVRLGSPRAYLYGIARNQALMRLRARRSRPKSSGYEPPETAPQGLTGVQTEQQRSDKIFTESLLATLESDERALLEMAFFMGYSHSELAERTGQPLGSVKSRLRRSLLKLRRQLEHS